ncbi:MAG: hypothetical protein IT287_00575 [Bdellovibrionaceae bacterium]|nr:hypothetical protein [Pseudobdellovibrionaceae bacterium]
MKYFLITASLLFSQLAAADRTQCVKGLSNLMNHVESDVRSMPKVDQSVHKLCVMWLYQRSQYEKLKKQNGGEDPCSSKSKDWRNILAKLVGAYSDAKTICGDSNTCSNGCGNALSVIRSGGSLQVALKSIPKD